MKITGVLYASGYGAYYYDDQAAIRAGARQDGFVYVGTPRTAGFRSIRQPAECLSVGLALEDGTVVWGDMMTVQYSGAAGRDPLFSAARTRALVECELQPRLIGRCAAEFIAPCDALLARDARGGRFPLTVEYGLSQALLRAAAHARHRTMAEVLCDELGLPLVARAVPLFAQSGDERHQAVDKMILKAVDVLPHGLINSPEKFGACGERFIEYTDWVARRIGQLGAEGYVPTIHIDVYGMMSVVLGTDIGRIVGCILQAEQVARPYRLQIESPVDFGARAAQIEGLAAIVAGLRERGSGVRILADEWCNTLEDIELFAHARAADLLQIKMPDVGRIQDSARAVLVCKANGVGAYLGGSCAETELSAAVAAHVAVATQADMVLAKPAMDVDAAVTIVGNEQSRLLAMLGARRAARKKASDAADVPSHAPSV